MIRRLHRSDSLAVEHNQSLTIYNQSHCSNIKAVTARHSRLLELTAVTAPSQGRDRSSLATARAHGRAPMVWFLAAALAGPAAAYCAAVTQQVTPIRRLSSSARTAVSAAATLRPYADPPGRRWVTPIRRLSSSGRFTRHIPRHIPAGKPSGRLGPGHDTALSEPLTFGCGPETSRAGRINHRV